MAKIKTNMNKIHYQKIIFLGLFLFISTFSFAQRLDAPQVDAQLFVGQGKKQALIVGLGGSEGGNAWASDYWAATRNQFIKQGYAFLAIGYFNSKGAPDTLNQIDIDKVHDAILLAAKNPLVDPQKIAIIGGSRGADLALLIGSYYQDIKCVVGIVASHAVFPGHTNHFSTSAWRFKGKELPFVPVNEDSVPFLMKRDLRGAFEAMLKDTVAEQKALIKVEQLNGPILLLSATKDEICPSGPMAEKMMARLKAKNFPFPYQHLSIEGGHAAPLQHFDAIFEFLKKNFK